MRLPAADDDVIISHSGITVTHSTGTHSVRSLTTVENRFDLAGGTLDIAASSVVSNVFNLNAGTLTGAGDLTVDGIFEWLRGTLDGSGRLVINGGQLDITSSGTHTVSRVIDATAGPVNWFQGVVTGTLTIDGRFNITGSGKSLDNLTVNRIGGLTVWDQTSAPTLANAVTFNNLAGAIFEIRSDLPGGFLS